MRPLPHPRQRDPRLYPQVGDAMADQRGDAFGLFAGPRVWVLAEVTRRDVLAVGVGAVDVVRARLSRRVLGAGWTEVVRAAERV